MAWAAQDNRAGGTGTGPQPGCTGQSLGTYTSLLDAFSCHRPPHSGQEMGASGLIQGFPTRSSLCAHLCPAVLSVRALVVG